MIRHPLASLVAAMALVAVRPTAHADPAGDNRMRVDGEVQLGPIALATSGRYRGGPVGTRLVLGQRAGRIALDGVFMELGLDDGVRRAPATLFAAGAELKVYLPIAGALELYLRGGAQMVRMCDGTGCWHHAQDARSHGPAWSYGTGLSWTGRVSHGVGLGGFVDLGRIDARLHGPDTMPLALDASAVSGGLVVSFRE